MIDSSPRPDRLPLKLHGQAGRRLILLSSRRQLLRNASCEGIAAALGWNSMQKLRLVIAWLLMAALPVQGFAAATMLLCDQGAVSVQADHEDYAGHGHHHAFGHGEDASAQASADSIAQGHGGKALGVNKGDKAHACGICASCCHAVALSFSPSQIPSSDSPTAAHSQPRVRVLTRAPPRPDKPPRA